VTLYAAVIALLFAAGAWLGASHDPLGHKDVLYFTLVTIIVLFGGLGSSVIRPWWSNGVLLGAAWVVLHAFCAPIVGDRWTHLLNAALVGGAIFAITSAFGLGVRAAVLSTMRLVEHRHSAERQGAR